MDDPEVWRWIWLIAIGVFGAGEALIAGSFFLLPFAAGSLVAAVVAFSGASVAVQWVSFVAVSLVGSLLLIPLRRRLDRVEPQDGIGSRRLIGQDAVVEAAIAAGPSAVGQVRIGRESWRAESIDHRPIDVGATVRVHDVRGTAVIVSTTP
jgi:membrane protein implicated in regulation of membrane protease activity